MTLLLSNIDGEAGPTINDGLDAVAVSMRRASSTPGAIIAVIGLCLTGSPAVQARELTFEQRVAAQEAIESVRWSHRIWPTENRGAKPPLSAVMPDDLIRGKVEDYLRKSNALESWWHRPVTAEQLQAEIERMSQRTRDPEMLRELYAALGNDPFVIGETLARQTLVERLIRGWYASDDRLHGALRQRVARALERSPSVAEMKALGGDYVERTVHRRVSGRSSPGHGPVEGAIELTDGEWTAWRQELAHRFGSGPDDIPLRRVSAAQEDADALSISAVLSVGSESMVVASVTWPKRPFDAWWAQERERTSANVAAAEAFGVTAPASGECIDDTWELRFYAPSGRNGHSAVWTGTEMIVWGGYNGFTFLTDGGRYNPSTDSWTPLNSGPGVPSGRRNHTAVWTGIEMIVWGGGRFFNQPYLSSGGRYNPTTDSWMATSNTAGVPTPRLAHTAVWTGNEMVVWGGLESGGTSLNSGGRYSPTTNGWTATSDGTGLPAVRGWHTAVWTGNEMIVWGGSNNGTYLSTGGRYDPATDKWTATPETSGVPSARERHTAVWTGSEMIIWGGNDFGDLNTGSRFNVSTNGWSTMSTSPVARESHTAVWAGSQMIVWGGYDSSFLNTGARYVPTTNSWIATSTANAPTGRREHTAVWTGSEMIVWGGDTGRYVNSGGRYRPATNSWVATSLGTGVPSPRDGDTAVWTGAEMIVWGGFAPTLVQTGSRYEPATDTWHPTSVGTNVPASRANHSAVWTGTEMIVWGGTSGSVYRNTGGRYNPTSDSWTPTSTGSSVPSGRANHTAIWSGTEMIVWGGRDQTHYLNSGGRYDPASNSWTATSQGTNLPSVRDTHTAVWTGAEMIVWGGYDGGELATGGRYDPASNSWLTTTLVGAPSARDSHTTVWTGTQMIVWGGYDFGRTSTGGRYDPTSDSWVETPQGPGTPGPREYHSGIWTGAKMIVWGGEDGTSSLDTGGRFDPVDGDWKSTSTGTNLPSARYLHNAVWTGERMLVWGGIPIDVNLGLYCVSSCVSTSTFYRDQDGDGYGNVAITVQGCATPPGYVLDSSDCNDGDPSIHPGAQELCNAVDDNCNTVVDEGASPGEVTSVSASKSATIASFDWPAIAGAASYDALRGTLGVWPVGSVPAAETCLGDAIVGMSISDADSVPAGSGHWYLVRAENACGNGGYGESRTSASCP